jgi:predicted N-formylglutamate amidohydrolase
MGTIPSSIPDVCEVTVVRGAAAAGAEPDLLLEVPHGATAVAHFAALRTVLRGDFPADLQDFFCVNTDIGAPEVAVAIAEHCVAASPRRAALVVRSLIPRTFIDCNRNIDGAAQPQATAAGQMTPGLPSWVQHPADRELLLSRYASYRAAASAAFASVCGRGGFGLMVHSYAPRSIDVPVDDRIVEHLRAAYAPDKIGSWPLRAEVDLITHDPDGRLLASPSLAAAVESACRAGGLQVAHNQAYAMHPVTLAHAFALQYPGRTLCFELRRDLLVSAFTPFAEMPADPAKVERIAAVLSGAVLAARLA